MVDEAGAAIPTRVLRAFLWAARRTDEHIADLSLSIVMDDGAYRAPRNYMMVLDEEAEDGVIRVAPQAARLESPTLRAMFMHEIGHVLQSCGLDTDRDDIDEEQEADYIVRKMTGVQIGYDPETMLQCFRRPGCIYPRPAGLR